MRGSSDARLLRKEAHASASRRDHDMMRALPARENAHSCRSDTMSATRKNLAKIRRQFGSPVGDAAAAATKILQSVISFVRGCQR